MSFLTIRMKKLDEDEWLKLKQVLKYLKGTSELKLALRVGDMSVVMWWEYVLYAVNED